MAFIDDDEGRAECLFDGAEGDDFSCDFDAACFGCVEVVDCSEFCGLDGFAPVAFLAGVG